MAASSNPFGGGIQRAATYPQIDDDEFEYATKIRSGKVHIINNYSFDGKMPDRNFSGLDRDSLLEAFNYVGYKDDNISFAENLKSSEMREYTEKIAVDKYGQGGSLVLVVLSYGLEKNIPGVDSKYLLGVDGQPVTFEYLLAPIRKSLNLKGLPKILLAQACNPSIVNVEHGTLIRPIKGDTAQHSRLASDASEGGRFTRVSTSEQSDVLTAYSMVPGTPNGSRFIQAFSEVMRTDGRRLEITTMLARASRILSYTPGTSMPNKSFPTHGVISQLRKGFFFV